MGYYSEIAICMAQEVHTAFQQKLAQAEQSLKENVECMLSEANFYEKNGDVLYYLAWIKWYDNYPEIAFMMNFLREFEPVSEDEDDEKDGDDCYRIIRIGEEYDDIETEGSYWDNAFCLDACRSIHFEPIEAEEKPTK